MSDPTKKTIVIPILQGAEAKNILRNDLFTALKQDPGIAIVILVPNEQKKAYFQAEFTGDNVTYEVINECPAPLGPLSNFLKKNLIITKTLDLKRANALRTNRNVLKYALEWSFSRLFGHRLFRRLVRQVDLGLHEKVSYETLFSQYQPDLLISGHLFGDTEAALLKVAKRNHVKTIGIINSWDKITARGLVRVLPDKLIVHNATIEDEAATYLDMSKEDMAVVGIPHNDIFFKAKPTARTAFFKQMGLDPKKKIILFCPLGKAYSNLDATFINLITEFIQSKQIPADLQLVVRFPPNDDVDLSGLTHRELITFDRPGKRFSRERGVDWDMNGTDIQRLVDTLHYSSLLICPPSSLSVDAAIFDKPVINIRFSKYDTTLPDINMYYETDHYAKLLKNGGIRVVRDEAGLLYWINKYYNEPETDRNERAAIVKQQCGRFDGKAGERAARFILAFLHNTAKKGQ